jgi:CRP/FNR family cyclic AMP-dependent transcriptional regulator
MISKEFLATIPIFKELNASDHETLATLWQKRSLSEGQILFRRGESGNSMFVIEQGVVEITVPVANQEKENRVAVLHAGQFIGELSLVDGLPRTASATALEDCELWEMKREDFRTFLTKRPEVAFAMVGEIGKRLRATNEQVMHLASKNINEEIEETLSFGDRLADRIAEFGGSWKFIITFAILLGCWIILNSILLVFKPFDEYPFVFLNLVLGLLTALQAPMIMMSQNRAQKKDRLKSDQDYQVSLKSELMLQQLHVKFDEERAAELQVLQEKLDRQLAMLERLVEGTEANSQSTLRLLDKDSPQKGKPL